MKSRTILTAMAFALLITGCGNSSSTRGATIQPIEPQTPIPDIGIGSVSYDPTCDSGVARIKYVYADSDDIDSRSFIITHSVDGVRESIEQAVSHSTGKVSTLEENVYISENETNKNIDHQIGVTYIDEGIFKVNNYAFRQPSCREEAEGGPRNGTFVIKIYLERNCIVNDSNVCISDIEI